MSQALALTDYATGATGRGEVLLTLVEVDSPDEYVAHEVAIPVAPDLSGEDVIDWPGARWLRADGCLGEPVHVRTVAHLRALQGLGQLPSDHLLLDAWEESGGREARVVWRLDVAI